MTAPVLPSIAEALQTLERFGYRVVGEPTALMTPVEAAAALRVSRSKVYVLIKSGRLPATRITGSIRIPRAALEQLIASSTTDGAA